MSTIVTRAGKGSSLTWTEADANFTNLNNDKLEASAIANMLETSDIGVTVQGYDANTTKNAATQTLTNKTILASGSNTIEATAGPDGSQLAGFRNKIINGGFAVNQRVYVSGAAVGANLYGHDRWKMAASADTYTFSTTANKTTVTIPAGKVLRQVIEGLNLQTGTYTLSWEGTAQGKIGAGSLSASGVTGSITGGTDTTIEFGPGTVANVQLEFGSIATPFEQRPIGLELALCQRYYIVGTLFFDGHVSSLISVVGARVDFKQSMRVSPTITYSAFINTQNASIGAERTHTTDYVQVYCIPTTSPAQVTANQSFTASAEL